MISLAICTVVYLLVCLAVGATLSVSQIVEAKDYALAEAAKPALGNYGLWFTVAIAMIATASGLLASLFAVSRMLTMLTNMELIPHSHFGMPGPIQKHLLVYTAVIAGLLAVFFDLSRIASLGAIFYLVMDIMIHWGVFRYLRKEVEASPIVLLVAIGLDVIALSAFIVLKWQADPMIIVIAIVGMVIVFAFERFFLRHLRSQRSDQSTPHDHMKPS